MRNLTWGGYTNGEIPLDRMTVVRGEHFEPEAAAHLIELEAAFTAKWGYPAIIIEGYRSLATQQDLYRHWINRDLGYNLAAYPGTSNHGYGRAADFGSHIDVYGSPQKDWMNAHAPEFGWHPAGDDFSPREAWHFEYWPGTATASTNVTPINNGTRNEQREDTMQYAYVDEKVVDVPGIAGVRNATWKTQRTWLQYSDTFYLEYTASQTTANQFADQMGNAAQVTRSFFDAVKRQQEANRAALAAEIAKALAATTKK